MLGVVKIDLKPVVKWSGSKRSQSDYIVNNMPKEINTYYEPFVGGASVLYKLLHTPEIHVKNYVCSDKNGDLISLWNSIIKYPERLVNSYELMWNELTKDSNINRRKEYFYEVRSHFNSTRSPEDFLFLSRTCTNGLIRYNSSGKFNTSLHFSRDGIKPKTLEKIIFDWSDKLNLNNVKFVNCEYEEINPIRMDFVYLDPPYANTKGMYYGLIDYEKFWEWMRKINCGYILSFDGKTDGIDNTFPVPKDLYDKHEYIQSGRSSFRSLKNQSTQLVEESLYIKL